MMKKYTLLLVLLICNGITGKASGQSGSMAESAWISLMEARYVQANGLATEAISGDRNSALAYAVRAYALLSENDFTAAEADLKKAISLEPKRSAWLVFLAYCYYLKGSDKELIDKTAHDALQLYNPKLTPTVDRYAYMLRDHLLNPSSGGGDFAIESTTALIADNPKFVLAYNIRALAFAKKDQYDKAIADYTKAVSINTRCYDAYLGRGDVYEMKRQHEPALADYAKAIELNPKNATLYNRLGNVYTARLDYEQAVIAYTKAIALDPKYTNAYGNRANAYESMGQVAAADADWTQYKNLGGKEAPDYSNLQRLYPAGKFDARLAQGMLEKGTATISGRACSMKEGYIWFANNVTITLYPATPYVEEWFELQKKKANRKMAVYMVQPAYDYSISVTSNQDGEFKFEGLKPGRYLLLTHFAFTTENTRDVYEGYQREGPAMVHYYHKEKYYNNYDDQLYKFVEIKTEGEAVKKVSVTKNGGRGCFSGF